MTFFTARKKELTTEEWDELVALKEAINLNPAAVHPEKMELFTELLVRSLEGKGDLTSLETHHFEINTDYTKRSTMENIDQHIAKDKQILDDPTISPQTRRHTAEELEALEVYKRHHPEDSHDPSSLELYCDTHPDALECRIYED